MTTQLLTSNFGLRTSTQFINSVSNTAYYVFAASSKPWANGVVPQYSDSPYVEDFSIYNGMLFGKLVQPTDTALLITGYPWTSGTVYTMYDDQDTNLENEAFYVYTFDGSYYTVFKCLFNNYGAPSTAEPLYSDTSASDQYYQTTDGYVWKYLYRFPTTIYTKFETGGLIPVIPDANVTANAISGSINVVVPVDSNGNIVTSSGSGYNNYYSGSLSSAAVTNTSKPIVQLDAGASRVNSYYTGCTLHITSGTGAGQYSQIVAHVANGSGTYIELSKQFSVVPDNTTQYEIAPTVEIIPSNDLSIIANNLTFAAIAEIGANTGNSVIGVKVLNPGSGVPAAKAYVNVSTQVGVTNTALLRAISSPLGGHGANVYSELYASTGEISVTFANSESNTIPTIGDYQTFGVLASPLFSNVVFVISNTSAAFSVGEKVTQQVGNNYPTAYVTYSNSTYIQVTNAEPFFATSPTGGVLTGTSSGATAHISSIENNGVLKQFSTFQQLSAYSGYYTSQAFTQNEQVQQVYPYGNSTATFFGNNSTGTVIYLTDKFGPIYAGNSIVNNSGSTFVVNQVIPPDLVFQTGEILYVENFTAVNRSNTQSETIKIVFDY